MMICILGLVAAGFVAGCGDEQAASRREVDHQLAKVMTLIDKAESGFVPQGSETEFHHDLGGQPVVQTKADLQAYRQRVLSEAAQELESLRNAGSTVQQVSARRVLADIYASQARDRLTKAMSRWAGLADRSAALINDLGAVGRAEVRVQLLDTDETVLLAELRKNRVATEQRIQHFEEDTLRLRRRAADLGQKIDQLKGDSEEAARHAQQLHGQALVATDSQQQYELHDQSATVDRRANVASAAAQEIGVQLDVIESELAVLSVRQQLEEQAIQTLNKQIVSAQERQARESHKLAVQSKSKTVQEMVSDFSQITDEYVRGVEGELDLTATKMNDAVEQLDAVSVASPRTELLLQLERLGHMADMTHVLTDHIVVAGCHGHTLAVIAQQARALMPDQVATLSERAKRVYTKQRELIESTKQRISDAMAICEQLRMNATGDERFVADLATELSGRLESYRDRIDTHRLSPPQG